MLFSPANLSCFDFALAVPTGGGARLRQSRFEASPGARLLRRPLNLPKLNQSSRLDSQVVAAIAGGDSRPRTNSAPAQDAPATERRPSRTAAGLGRALHGVVIVAYLALGAALAVSVWRQPSAWMLPVIPLFLLGGCVVLFRMRAGAEK